MLATDKMSVVHKDIHAAPALRSSPPVLYDGHLVRREHVERAVPGRATLDDQVNRAGTGDTPFENRLVRHGRGHWWTTKHTKSTKVSANEAFDASFR
ncbi:MAG: hypothetical protein RLY70_3188, partial [Planctomycetota bacterium]